MLRRYLQHYDYTLLILTIALVVFGLIMIHSVQPSVPEGSLNFVQRQLIWFGVGAVAMMIVTLIDYRMLGALTLPMYIGVVAVLGLVALVGDTSFGATRWFEIANQQVQPSEFAKLTLIIVISKYLSAREGEVRALLISGLLVFIPVIMLLLQPNLSTALILSFIWLSIAFMAGLPMRWLLALGLVVLISMPVVWPHLEQYQRDRILIFRDPWADPTGQGFNLIHSRTAVGNGGLLGQGYDQGSQTQLGYLRVRQTDFIFSAIAEELGFVGGSLLIIMLMLFLLRLVKDILLVKDPFGRLIVAGIGGWLFFQIYVNIGVNLGLAPPTGVPLPFISYGGSNLVTLMMSLGLVQSILIRQKRFEFE